MDNSAFDIVVYVKDGDKDLTEPITYQIHIHLPDLFERQIMLKC